MALIDVQRRLTELGRIRLGEKGSRGEPKRLTRFRLTSASRSTLEAAAALYGGTVRPWAGAPDEGYFELYTEADEIDVLIPPTLSAYSQFYETWDRGGIQRRCDGRTEMLSGEACLCDPDDRLCDVVTRMNVMLPRVPGLGVWRLETKGWNAAVTLPTTLDLLASTGQRTFVPAVLRLEQRTAKRPGPDGKPQTRRFVVPVLDLPNLTIGELVGVSVDAPPVALPPAQLGPVNRRERVARPATLPAPADPEPPAPSRPRPAFAPPPEIVERTAAEVDADDASMMDDIVSEALDAPPPMTRGEFLRAATSAHRPKADVLAAHKALGISLENVTDADYGRLADHLGISS